MKDKKKLRFECIRCGNCCTDKNTLVNLTYLDILKIKNSLDLDINEVLDFLGFYIFDKLLTEGDKRRMIIPPIETEKGLAFIGLIKNSLGGCYFYDSQNKKCLIYDIRPMFCKTFPFSFGLIDDLNTLATNNIDIFYTEKGKLYCPGIGAEAPFINTDSWTKLGINALKELKKNSVVIEDWNKQVKEKKKTATVKNFLYEIFKVNNL
jgi:Fe-S-cluster containining protein